MRKLYATPLLVLAFVASLTAQITVPFSFTAGTVIDPDQMNSNFTAVSAACNRSGCTMTGVLKAVAGIAANPGIANSTDPTTGIIIGATGTIGWSLSGTQRMLLNGSGLTVYGVNVINASGAVLAPTLSGDIPAAVTQGGSAIVLAGRNTLWVPAVGMSTTVTNGATGPTTSELTAGQPNVTAYSFVNGAQRNVQFAVAFPKSWNAGTVTYQAYWTGTVAGAGTTIWGVQCLASADNATIDGAFGTAQEVTDTFLTVKFNHVSPESSALTITGAAADTHTTCQVYRKGASDTRAQASLLLGVKFYFTTNAKNDT